MKYKIIAESYQSNYLNLNILDSLQSDYIIKTYLSKYS